MSESRASHPLPAEGGAPEAARLRNLVFAGFVLTGVVTTILGPILPFLSARWSLNDAQAGFFFTAQFLGSLSGVGAFSVLSRRRGLRGIILAGYLLMIAGVALLAARVHGISLLGIFLAGASLGMVITASNLLVAAGSAANRAAVLSLLNVAWGVGAALCPFLVAVTVPRVGLGAFLLLVAGALAMLFLALAASRAPRCASATEAQPPAAGRPGNSSRFAGLAGMAALFFLYVGTENALGGWATSFAKRLESGHQQMAQLAPTLFWGALLLGRVAAPALLRHVSELRIALGGLALVFASSLFLQMAAATPAALAGLALAGLGCAAVFPIFVAWLSALPGFAQSGLRGVPFACGNLGGATLPWLVGAVSTRFGGLKPGFLVVVLASALLLVSTRIVQRRIASPPRAAQ
ncbi:MAG: MFS transporter [Acidobacteriia bacterium]|nr:MFS transporter [Terriglobia bacterium]